MRSATQAKSHRRSLALVDRQALRADDKRFQELGILDFALTVAISLRVIASPDRDLDGDR
jgi:hypothetical protein